MSLHHASSRRDSHSELEGVTAGLSKDLKRSRNYIDIPEKGAPEKGGRKPALSPNLFVSPEKCRGSGHDRSYHPKRPLTIPYEQKPKPSAAPLEDFSLRRQPFAPPFLSITSHPLANYLVPNPNGRCSPLSFGVPPFSSVFPLLLTIFLHILSFFSNLFPAVPPLSSVFLLRNLP